MFQFEKVKHALEFDKLIDFIASRCVSATGQARMKNVRPFQDKSALERVMHEIQEMREVFLVDGGFPIWDYCDVRILLNKIEPAESYLEAREFLQLQNFLEVVTEIKQFKNSYGEKYPHLSAVIEKLQKKDNLLSQFRFTFEPSGRIYDNASPELKSIRREISQLDAEIHERLDRIIRKKKTYLQEEYQTLRDGRLVLPVREFSVSKIPGIVHGQSATGQTYFVEPMAVVDLNNQLQKLHAAEQKEIVKILKRLSNQVRSEQTDLIMNLDLLNVLDVLQAKAKYANEFKASAPQINDDFAWEIVRGSHPLLLKMHPDTTVPLNLKIGEENQVLIISGPNAGGKTVALKTVGNLQLMFQCGFQIPVAEGTKMPICKQIFTTIGDEQSIEQDLSTFSSHIKSLNTVIENLDDHALVLVDEIGSGTEPSGGAALSMAFMENMNRPHVVTIVTTHQNILKSFASETPGIENAAMQFDMENMNPLFILEMGVPGSSYTFDICRRLGLDETILQRAIALSGKESFELDKLLKDVVDKSRRYQQMSDEIAIKQSELNGLIQLYKEHNAALKKQRRKIDKEAAQTARERLDNVNREIEAAIREIKESQADKQVVKKAKARIEKQKQMFRERDTVETGNEQPDIDALREGQKVRSRQYGITGTISKIFRNKKEIEIEREGLKLAVDLSDIELLDQDGKALKSAARIKEDSPAAGAGVSANIPNECDLRGLMVEEALRKVESYLDTARLSHWDEVRLVHGKGTGALRAAVHKYLAGQRDIKNYRLGKIGEGDSGVTVVEL